MKKLFFVLCVLFFAVGAWLWNRFDNILVGRASDGIYGGLLHDPAVDYSERNELAKRTLVTQVDDLSNKLGRVPVDQNELEEMLDSPLPTIWFGGREVPVRYVRISSSQYYLSYESVEKDDWIYDSTKRDLGWFQAWN